MQAASVMICASIRGGLVDARVFVTIIVALLFAAGPVRAGQAGPVFPKAAQPTSCPHDTTISGVVELDPSCAYDGFVLNASNTRLDCRGATIGGSAGGDARGIMIRGDIDDVIVENCWLEGTKGIKIAPPDRDSGETDDELRARSPRGVVIRNVSVRDSRSAGIFVGPVVAGARIEDSVVEHSESSGIYLEYGTQHIEVRRNVIRSNGHVAQGVARTEWTRREGIAVDASAFNVIEENVFEKNAFGGVFFYKNCWEDSTVSAKSRPRAQHAHHNRVSGNWFREMPIGVWIASRQARDLGAWDCGDTTPYPNPIALKAAFPPGYPTFRSTYPARYDFNLEYLHATLIGRPCPGGDCSVNRTAAYIWEDFAEDNVVSANRFEALTLAGVRVEDDRAEITGNSFVGDFDYVFVGTPFRSRYLGRPVQDALIRDNCFSGAPAARPKFEDNIALVPGEHAGTTLSGNGCTPPPPPSTPTAPDPPTTSPPATPPAAPARESGSPATTTVRPVSVRGGCLVASAGGAPGSSGAAVAIALLTLAWMRRGHRPDPSTDDTITS